MQFNTVVAMECLILMTRKSHHAYHNVMQSMSIAITQSNKG
ncbi:hypothetical protein SynSYN20_00909 [Synechococcus sp. SYN20]|nr:hypothetical protein SynSYN20_00909 [Synechococcus sp. SYN20]